MLLRSCIIFLALLFATSCSRPPSEDNPSPPKSPEEELLTFQLPPDLQIQLVASEPMIEDPVVMQFDEDGRLWVVEMRGFMPDIDGTGENDRTGRISILEDEDGDGMMDKSTVYIDSLILPRSLAVVKGGALIVEDYKLWMTQDTNGDLVADTKELVDSTYGGTRLPEHSGNGLWRGMDNWYYNARSSLRYKFENGKVIRDSTEFRGQWGMSHDDWGRLHYNYNWSQLHADLVPPNYLYANKHHTPTSGIDHGLTLDRRVYPIRPNPAVNRGYIPGTLDEEGRLLEFTAACSPYVYRGSPLPIDNYNGNVFVCEPSGNLVKRNVIEYVGYNLKAKDPDPGREFLASSDERFRPVYITSGPDGYLYVADMYRGLVQHGEYVTLYLRDQTLKRKLDAPIHYGRIWRIVPSDPEEPVTVKKLSKLSSLDLVGLLYEDNGWTRDMAQRLLVERKDTTIVDALKEVAGTGFPGGALHALWTLDGIHANDRNLLLGALHWSDFAGEPATALRLLETFATNDPVFRTKLGKELLAVLDSAGAPLLLQAALSARYLDPEQSFPIYKYVLEKRDTPIALMPDAVLSGLSGKELAFTKTLLADENWKTGDGFRQIFLENLATTIVKRRRPNEIAELFSIISKEDPSSYRKAAFVGAVTVQGRGKWKALKLRSEPVVLKRTEMIGDQQRTIINNMFEWPGHTVDTEAIKSTINLTEAQQKLFADGRQQYLGVCAGCHGNDGEGIRRLAPPLAGSEWVLGDERRLALLVLHGIEGEMEVAGKRYGVPDILPVMPSHSPLDDGAITSILIYIRNEWGNNAGGVNRRTVGRLRHTTQGRVVPWTVRGLNEHMVKIDTIKTE
ncbi:MAG TPA: c-type cytochrome [Cyclobacteriaceae bacterium]|nr:c-type cytochrome [Cyclobacteriaceae bacterium]